MSGKKCLTPFELNLHSLLVQYDPEFSAFSLRLGSKFLLNSFYFWEIHPPFLLNTLLNSFKGTRCNFPQYLQLQLKSTWGILRFFSATNTSSQTSLRLLEMFRWMSWQTPKVVVDKRFVNLNVGVPPNKNNNKHTNYTKQSADNFGRRGTKILTKWSPKKQWGLVEFWVNLIVQVQMVWKWVLNYGW